MESHYTISTLHLVDSGQEINEDDYISIKLSNGSIFKGVRVTNIMHDAIEITYDNNIDGDVTIPYSEIDSIELVGRGGSG